MLEVEGIAKANFMRPIQKNYNKNVSIETVSCTTNCAVVTAIQFTIDTSYSESNKSQSKLLHRKPDWFIIYMLELHFITS